MNHCKIQKPQFFYLDGLIVIIFMSQILWVILIMFTVVIDSYQPRPLISIVSDSLSCYMILYYASSQEIKFEPSVMCEHLDEGVSFTMSQVSILV